MKIAVIGTGYVGLVTGTCFAETGNVVTCVDVDQQKINKLNAGEITIYEPGLEKLFLRNQKEGRLKFTQSLADAIVDAQIIFLALPTPPGADGAADLKYILGVANDLGKLLNPNNYVVIVDKSTVPVGTADKVHNAIVASATIHQAGKNIEHCFDVVSNPEFLREGVAVDDFMKPDRVVIGTTAPKAIKVMNDLYTPFVRQGNPLIFMDEKSAELTKYAANAFLAVKISFMNEIAQMCERLGADVDMVRKGIGSDDRIGKRFLFPGIGYGGSCFPKDVQALAKTADDINYDFKILDAVMDVNAMQKLHLIPKIKKYFNNNLKGKHFALWGLAFKPNTDDVREAPAYYMIDALLAEGATIAVFDPEAINNTISVYGNKIVYANNQYEALFNADALLIATEWNEFRTPDFEKISSALKNKLIFDGRNVFDPAQMQELGYHYESIGRKIISNK
ncbi:UDP-glucose dehydrogenase family protein [Ferruginibacter yonginensis]|uniref:UDP-glucose 6-dehydrogenase n=1 Tax=Ferruginibacter yonginensis TaxID=1310416 RepID=A0ABV8QVA4_9BACT